MHISIQIFLCQKINYQILYMVMTSMQKLAQKLCNAHNH